MLGQQLLTHEIGSLAKPSWRVKAIAGRPLDDKDLADAASWGKTLQVDGHSQLLELLARRVGFSDSDKAVIMDYACLYAIRLLEEAGLDLVWDGEQQRTEMYEYPLRHCQGFIFRGHVRSFDNKYYYKASCVDSPSSNEPYHVSEYLKIARHARRPVKIPVTGPYTIVDWSFDEHYGAALAPGQKDIRQGRLAARRRFLSDVAANIVYPNILALYEAGARYIQIDEPAATTKRDEIGLFLEALRQSVGALAGRAFFAVHICFSDYKILFPAIDELAGVVDELHFEYANRDSWELGTAARQRPGYAMLSLLRESPFKIGLGVLDVHTDVVEKPELIRDRIRYALDVVQEPARLLVAPDCGLRTRTWEVAFAKLKNMVAGRDMAMRG